MYVCSINVQIVLFISTMQITSNKSPILKDKFMSGHYNIMVAPDVITLARIINPVLLLNSTYSEMQVHKTWRYDCVKDFNTSLKYLCSSFHLK